ncbi:MAG TPA: MFS transporter [Candidatus Dormibacteraeota bacterium]|nr:MFS transporter [Candidatus Dormibacteraeota bacterium]
MLVRRNRGFSIFLVTQGASNLGDAVRNVAVPLFLLQLTHAPALAAALGALEAVSMVALQLPAGALVDRWDRRRTLLLADVGRGLLTLAIPAVALAHGPVVPMLFASTAPLSALSALFGSGFASVTPSLVGREGVERAYALTEAAESLAWVLGPVLAGLLVATAGGPAALAVDGVSFLLSALGLALIRVPPVARAAAERRALWRGLLDGLRFLATHRVLWRAQLSWTLYGTIGYGVVLGLVYVGSRAGSAGGARLASLAVAAYAAGSLLGTLLAGWRRPPAPSLAVAGVLAALAAGAALVATGLGPGVLAGAGLFGLGEGYFAIVWMTARAEVTPDELMGRVTGVSGLLAQAAGAIAVAWMGAALQLVGGPGAFTLLAALTLLLAAWIALARPLPAS